MSGELLTSIRWFLTVDPKKFRELPIDYWKRVRRYRPRTLGINGIHRSFGSWCDILFDLREESNHNGG